MTSNPEMLRHIGDLFPGPVFTYGISARTVLYANGAFADAVVLPGSKKATGNQAMQDLIHPDDRAAFETGVIACAALQENRTHAFTCRLNRNENSSTSWQLTGRLLQDNESPSILFFAQDVSEQVHRDMKAQEMEQKINELKRSNKDLEEFAYIASHDMHEPLRKVHSFADRLKSKYSVSVEEEAKGYLDRILAATQSARLMIDGLMEFSRLTRTTFGFQTVNMNELVKDVLGDLELKIEETGTRLDVEHLPTIEAIPIQMKQLFTNIILNAIKFRKEDVTPHIRIQSRQPDREENALHHLAPAMQYCQFTITDNGIGFEEEHAETIFQMFQRLNGKSEFPGSGIGLALCKKIAETHHGTITANSHPGKGTVITIILPIEHIA